MANAVNDLRGNWLTLATMLLPLVLLGALCLLPDALNIQRELAERFAPGGRSVGWLLTQEPYSPAREAVPPLFSPWVIALLHLVLALLTSLVSLIVACMLRRLRANKTPGPILSEAVEIYREATKLVLAFYWIVFLQWIVPLVALSLRYFEIEVEEAWIALVVDSIEIAVLAFGTAVYLWLYFARYALVFAGRHSFHALLFSRDLMRKRFYRVATRIVVFLAVWSGYTSWAASFIVIVSVVLGPVGVVTGYFWATIFGLDLATVAIFYLTVAFFVAADVRLYQDLVDSSAAGAPLTDTAAPAVALPSATA